MKNQLTSKQTAHRSSSGSSPETSSPEIAVSRIPASAVAPEKLPSILPQLIRETRQRLGLTQTQFAAKLGVSFLSVNRWENGHHQPLPIVLKQIETLLHGMGAEGQDLLAQYLAQYSEKFVRKD